MVSRDGRELPLRMSEIVEVVTADFSATSLTLRYRFRSRQRLITMAWIIWCSGALTTRLDPVPPPADLVRQQDFGHVGEKAARAAWAREELQRRGHLDGRPKEFDTGIDSPWNLSLGVRKGWAGRS